VADRPYTSRAKRSLELADQAAEIFGHSYIGTEHLLIGLLDEEHGPAAQILHKLGVTADAVRREVRGLLGTP
jgi:ATP-dependent Clp protease ATP-binding subunit ClpC